MVVGEDELKHIVSLLRVAVPYTGIILSTRETPQLRDELFRLAVSGLGGAAVFLRVATRARGRQSGTDGDFRSLPCRITGRSQRWCARSWWQLHPQFLHRLLSQRAHGRPVMELAKTAEIHEMCQPNALVTLKEYLETSPTTRPGRFGEDLIRRNLDGMPEKLRTVTQKMLSRVEAGERDISYRPIPAMDHSVLSDLLRRADESGI